MGAVDRIVAGLNPAQREAALATTGPLVILAGAGTGKTTTVTHRIAVQVASGAFAPGTILAVTFTEKAAGELKSRLADLGAQGVEARTFHAAALSQLRRLWDRHTGSALPDVLDSKAPLIASLANALPPPYKFLPRRELAGEIEWAKNRMIGPDMYAAGIQREGHEPPIPADLMLRIFRGYEQRKERMGRIDFEDMLGLAVRLFDDHPAAAAEIRQRHHAFTVDEYQDVNPLQQALLERWLGDRDDVCVVGDDYQTIYAFTGASPQHLLDFPQRYPAARVVRLQENYRSTPQVLAVANALTPTLGGFAKTLTATRSDGPSPTARVCPDPESEVSFVVGEVRRLLREGTPLEQMAVLYRINARSERYEEAFAAAGVPYQVRDGAFLRRPGPRAVLARLRREVGDLASAVGSVTEALGYDPTLQPEAEEEVTRQADLGRMRALAQEFAEAHPDGDPAGFAAELANRFAVERTGRGVNLLTFHRSKGLEFEAVFLPRLLAGELPFKRGRTESDIDEERRLLYVGITRARTWLYLSWPREAKTAPSPFLQELGLTSAETAGRAGRPSKRSMAGSTGADGGPLFDRLREWRKSRASTDGVPAYVIFHDKTLAEIASSRPKDWADLSAISGVGEKKLDLYADDVLEIVARG
ncbi:MAG: ATP-dependent DNA helicase UvrD2 [Actinobacteria bacterium]|nr:ATP-dependent DNA helicase UvrD2 [Actinomycetota bacterium]